MLDLGRYHLAALAQSEGTKALASAFEPIHSGLQTAAEARVQAEKAMTVLRVGVRFAEDGLERAIRQVALLAHTVDNNATTGPAYKALFPDGLDAEVRPIGASQVDVAVALRARMDSQPAAAPVKAQATENLDKALAAFRSALAARTAGETQVSQARAAEMGARERFVSAYDANMGAIRQLFPRERAQQNLYFDELGSSRAPAEDDSTPPPSPAPAPGSDVKTQ
jgi:hypothetical protein